MDGRAAWEAALGMLDPAPTARTITPADFAALRTPATLAAHLWPGYQTRAHTTLVAAAIADVERDTLPIRDGPRLMIDQPPQCGKTLTAVVWAAFWWLCKRPTDQIMVICYGMSLATSRGSMIRNLIMTHGARYGLHLDPSTRAKHDFQLLSSGAVRCFGIKTGITGNPADACWIDDATKSRAEADSPVYRAAIHDAYSADITSRLAPGAPVVIVATRWTDDDLSGRREREEGLVGNGGRWRKLHLPAICVDPATDALERGAGEPLPHPKVPEGDTVSLLRHWEERRRVATPRDWAALYQGDPKPAEGALLTWQLLRERRCFETNTCAQPKTIAVSVDPSGGGRDVAGIIGGYLGEDDRLYLTHDRSGVMASDLWARKACELAAEIDADRFVIERNYGGDMAALVLRTAWMLLRRENPDRYSVFMPRIVTVVSKRGKLLRAEPIAQQWIEDRIRTAQYLADVEAEWCTWQDGSPESPGRIDASVHLAYELLPLPQSGETVFVDSLRMGAVDLTVGLTPGDMGLIR